MNILNRKSSYIKYADKSNISEKKWEEITKFNSSDFGWIIMSIGASLGASISCLPIQAGLSGLLAFIVAAFFAFPAIYFFQKIVIDVLSSVDCPSDYVTIISKYLGKDTGLLLGGIYFLLLIIILGLYSTIIVNDIACFINIFTGLHLNANNVIFCGVVMLTLTFLSFQTEKLIFKLSSFLVLLKLFTLIILTLVVVSFWNLNNVSLCFSNVTFLKETMIMLPFCLMSFIFINVLSPMVMFYKKQTKNKVVARYKSLRVMKISYFIMLFVITFYILSFNLALNYQEIVYAYTNNISTLAIAARNLSSDNVKIFSITLNIVAILTAFFSVFLSFKESFNGILINIIDRFNNKDKISCKKLNMFTFFAGFLICYGIVIFNIPILLFTKLLSPIFGIVGGIVPSFILLKFPSNVIHYSKIQLILIMLFGIILIICPLFSFM